MLVSEYVRNEHEAQPSRTGSQLSLGKAGGSYVDAPALHINAVSQNYVWVTSNFHNDMQVPLSCVCLELMLGAAHEWNDTLYSTATLSLLAASSHYCISGHLSQAVLHQTACSLWPRMLFSSISLFYFARASVPSYVL